MDHWRDDKDATDLTPASWLKFGQRNVLYIAFLTLLVPLGLALDGPHAAGTRGPGGLGFAFTLCGIVSVAFFAMNASVLLANLARRRHVTKALIGCALPALCGSGAMVTIRFLMS